MPIALLQGLAAGWVEIVGVDEHGESVFRLTETGERRAKEIAASRGMNLDNMEHLSFVDFASAMGLDGSGA